MTIDLIDVFCRQSITGLDPTDVFFIPSMLTYDHSGLFIIYLRINIGSMLEQKLAQLHALNTKTKMVVVKNAVMNFYYREENMTIITAYKQLQIVSKR
jgi:hypothetical protein